MRHQRFLRAIPADPMTDSDRPGRDAYLAHYGEWREQIERLHAFFFEGERIDPPRLKGILNHEARAWEAYVQARRQLLGLEE